MSKRSASGGGTIRQRPDGRWEARATLGRDPATGRQVQKSFYGKTQKEVRQKLQAACLSVDDGTYTEPSKLTLAQWLDVWEADYLGDVKKNTLIAYSAVVRTHIKPALGAVKLSDLGAHMVQRFYNKLNQTLSAKYIKNIHGVLHRALAQAVAIGYIKSNPADACTLPRVVKPEIKPLDEEATRALLNAIAGHRFEALYTVDLFTGMRLSEILGLQWSCVDFNNGVIRIDKQLLKPKSKAADYWFDTLKNDKPRTITPAAFVMDVLRAHKRRQAEQRIAAGSAWSDGGFPDLVFTDELGGHLRHNTVYSTFKRFVQASGVPETRFHDLRHSYAVAALRSGDDIKTVQANLGHHSAAFTLDTYGHVTEQMKQASAARMQNYIENLKAPICKG